MGYIKNIQTWQPIEITEHAKLRLRERVGSYTGFRDWQDLVKTARYKGKTEHEMTGFEHLWCLKHIGPFGTSSQVRILNGFAFIFKGRKGHARKLVTVIKIE